MSTTSDPGDRGDAGDPLDDLEDLRARSAIRDVLVRYFHGADSAAPERVRSCFTTDAVARFEGRPTVRGVDAVIGQMAVFPKIASGEWTVTTHFMGSLQFKSLDRTSAETETYAFAFLVMPGGDGQRVQMRSLRYVDCFVRTDEGWKIAARLHTLDWSCEVPCTFARAFAERQTAPPAA